MASNSLILLLQMARTHTHTQTRAHAHTHVHSHTKTLQPSCALKRRKEISQHPSLCFATIKRPSKHLHLWDDPACDNGSDALHAAVHPVSVAVGQKRASSPRSFLSLKTGRWGRLNPLKINGLYRLDLRPCSDLNTASCTGIRQVFNAKVLKQLKKRRVSFKHDLLTSIIILWF